MAKTLSLTGIVTGLPVEAEHVSQSILALTGAEAYDITISGSLEVIGTTTLDIVTGSDFSGSFQGDGSRLTGITSSYITGSGVDGPYGPNSIISSSYAVTSSYSEFATIASSSLVSDFTLTANSATSASYAISASVAQTASYVEGTVDTASFVTASNVWGPYGSNSIVSASFALSASIAESASFADTSFSSISASRAELAGVALTAETASYVRLAETASYIRPNNLQAAGTNSQVQFNNEGSFFGATNLIYSQSNGYLSVATSSYSTHPLEVGGQIAQTGLGCSVALGRNALINLTSGTQNVAIGERAMFTTDSGLRNVAVGFQALEDNAAASRNVAVGYQALNKAVSPNNVAVGAQALFNSLCGQDNVGIGNCALYSNVTGRCNIAIGSESSICNSNGVENVSIGFETLRNSTSGQRNVSIGHQAMNSITTGVDNVALGWNAGFYASISSTGNVFLGKCAGPSTLQPLSNKLYINNTQGSPLICGDFSLRQVNIDGAFTASGLIYPTSDGTSNQVLTTDGQGNLSFGAAGTVETASYVSSSNVDGPLGMDSVLSSSYAVTASYALNGGGGGGVGFPFVGDAVITGSLLVSSSFVDFTDTTGVSGSFSGSFEGDGSGLTGITVAEVATVEDTFTGVTSVSVTHNFGTKNVIVQVYDNNDNLIIPASITTTNDNTVDVTFSSSTSGRVVVAKGGHIVSVTAGTYRQSISGASSYTITHNLDEDYPMVQVYDSSKDQVIPATVTSTSTNTIDLSFSSTFAGTVVVKK